ncbi:MAG TPA: presqualene diphosphate synthase HpnD [Burkholderiales bacterium]|nr:presqualene diphosphate synthase HpnD [Burkholderiales bacterium]
MTPDEYCHDKAASSGSSFYYSVLFLPKDTRRALTALFACFREIQEIAHECTDPAVAKIKLQWWRQELAAAFSKQARHPITQALLPSTRQFGLPPDEFLKIIDGVETGLAQTRHPDFASLKAYCRSTHGVAERLAARILGVHHPNTLKCAQELGLAFGLTDVILNVRDDARRNRILLPQDELARFGVTVADLLNLRETEGFKKMIEFAIDRAESCYNRAISEFPAAERKAQRGRLALAAINRALLREIRKDGCRILRRRVDLTPIRKLWLAWMAWMEV